MFQRMFHPVGQGAFYTERHEEFNVVYDCGSSSDSKNLKDLVKNSFPGKSDVDLLFISHFDDDHVNLIPALMKKYKVKRVVLPVIDAQTKLLLIKIYQAAGQSVCWRILVSPEEYFKGSDIIHVLPDEYDSTLLEKLNLNGNEKILKKNEEVQINKIMELNEKKNSMIVESGCKLKVEPNWVYVPFNKQQKISCERLVKELLASRIDVIKVKNDKRYFDQKRNELKEVYNKLSGKINENSMFLYSGAYYLNAKIRLGNLFHSEQCRYLPLIVPSIKSGCIYTGDGDMKKVIIQNEFKEYMRNINTIQIPHHGTLSSFNTDPFGRKKYICPISVGLKNQYGHPSPAVIAHLWRKGSVPVLITENADSTFLQQQLP